MAWTWCLSHTWRERNACFGETHVRTSWSLDAFSIGNTLTTPADAYNKALMSPEIAGGVWKRSAPLDPGSRAAIVAYLERCPRPEAKAALASLNLR
jgi:hypothetical protein